MLHANLFQLFQPIGGAAARPSTSGSGKSSSVSAGGCMPPIPPPPEVPAVPRVLQSTDLPPQAASAMAQVVRARASGGERCFKRRMLAAAQGGVYRALGERGH